jgi:putative toxin-antitoxin system antitoxin component (TIGR02293 family)
MAHAHAIRIGPQNAVHGARGAKRGNRSDRDPVKNLVTMAAAAEKGISKERADRLFRRIAVNSPLPMGKLRAQLIPDSSWKRAGKTLGPQASQTVARLEHILSFATSIWEDEAAAMRWLNRPHMELRDATPISLVRTEAGGRAVELVLAAIEYGFPV